MKKYFIVPLLLTILVFISSCRKSLIESPDESVSKSLADDALQNQCQLTQLNAPNYYNQFHYNEKGLVDEWRMDFGSGIPQVYTMTYDDQNKLIRALLHYQGRLIATIDFTWTGNLLTNEHWSYQGFEFDYVNTYDRKGQRIGTEGSDGFSTVTEWSANGNPIKTDIFIGDELYWRDEFTYNQPNKNPYNALNGIPYAFPFLHVVFGKSWETSEKITIFGDVIYELDPSQTVFQFGQQNYLTEANNFDVVSNSPIDYSFEYQNCESETNVPTRLNNFFTPKGTANCKIDNNPRLLQKVSLGELKKKLQNK
jgi:hypothetical protein